MSEINIKDTSSKIWLLQFLKTTTSLSSPPSTVAPAAPGFSSPLPPHNSISTPSQGFTARTAGPRQECWRGALAPSLQPAGTHRCCSQSRGAVLLIPATLTFLRRCHGGALRKSNSEGDVLPGFRPRFEGRNLTMSRRRKR